MTWNCFCCMLPIISIVHSTPQSRYLQKIPQMPLILECEKLISAQYVRKPNDSQSYFYMEYGKIKEYIFPTPYGLRQDFLLPERFSFLDDHWIYLRLKTVPNYKIVQVAVDKIILEYLPTRRKITYSHLKVFDANGKRLLAKFSSESDDIISISICDSNAKYPIYIDPTYIDEDWESLSPNWTNGIINSVDVNKNTGEVYVGGAFTSINGVSANRVARYNGTQWQPLGQGFNNTVMTILVASSGNVYAGGSFTNSGVNQRLRVAVWSGTSWLALGSGFDNIVYALVKGADGKLYAGGSFTKSGDGSKNLNHIAYWDGSTWDEPSLGVGSSGDYVMALSTDTLGNVYVGGKFQTAGGISASNIARWNTTTSTWHPLGSGVNGAVYAIAVDSSGRVYVGGEFTTAGATTVNRIALWDGISWSSLGTGADGIVYALEISNRLTLFVGGMFNYVGNTEGPNHLAWWHQSGWNPITSGVQGSSFYIRSLALDSNNNLYVAGSFYTAGNVESYNIAKLKKPPIFEINYVSGPGGIIAGDSHQYVMRGDDGTQVTAQPLTGFQFDRWSDGNTSPSRIETNVASDLQFTAYFLPTNEGFPQEGTSEGSLEGYTEGFYDGQLEGNVEGSIGGEGNADGVIEGIFEGGGEGEGINEGILEGEYQDGISEGFNEGAEEGSYDGYIEGISEGSMEGIFEGSLEGSEEGIQSEGDTEGYSEGEPPFTVWIDSPAILNKEVGDTLSLLVKTAGGIGNLTFQWYRQQDSNTTYRLEDQTNAFLYIENLQLEDTGWYWCEVSDNFSVVLSNKIYVRVFEGLNLRGVFFFTLYIMIISALFILFLYKHNGEGENHDA